MNRESSTTNTQTTATRWARLAEELHGHGVKALADNRIGDDVRERVGLILTREAVALRAASVWARG